MSQDPLDLLAELMERATPGRCINNPVYECIHTHSDLVKLRPVLHYSHNNPNAENDAELFAALRNSAEALVAIARAARGMERYGDTSSGDDAKRELFKHLATLTPTQPQGES